MFDIIEGKATPSLARKLLAFSQVSSMDLSQDIIDLAGTELLPKFTENPHVQRAVQLLSDFAFRGLMIDRSKECYGFAGILEYLRSTGRDNIVFVVPHGSESIHVKSELKLLQDIVPGKYIIRNAKQEVTTDKDAFVIFKGVSWGGHQLDFQRWAFSNNDILAYYPYANLLDASTINSMLAWYSVLTNNQNNPDFADIVLGAKDQIQTFEALGISVIPPTR